MRYLIFRDLFFLPTWLSIGFLISGCGISVQDDLIVSSETALVLIGNQELVERLESEDNFFLYVGRPTCPVCQEFEPILEQTLKERGEKIYYFNTDKARKQDEEQMESLADKLGVLVVPAILYIENGEVVSLKNGVLTLEELTVFFEKNFLYL